ncbi:MAG: hypothetical protein D6707_11935, partial [Bacteroidetes bacterium]
MKDFKYLFALVTAMSWGLLAYSQQEDYLRQEIDSLNLKPRQLKKLGKQAEKYGDYYSAIDYYQKYLDQKPDNLDFEYKIAGLYLKARDYGPALEHYQKVYEADPDRYPMALFYIAQLNKIHEQDYDKALDNFNDFKKKHKAAAGDKSIRKLLKYEIESCELAKKLIENELKVNLVHLDTSINKAHMEAAPRYYNDTLMYYS